MSGDVVSQNLERLTRDTTQTWQIEIESSTNSAERRLTETQ